MSSPLHESVLAAEFTARGITLERQWSERERRWVLVVRPREAVTPEMAATIRRVRFALLGAIEECDGPVAVTVCDRCRWVFVVPPAVRCSCCVLLAERHRGRWFEIPPGSEAERVLLAELDRRAQQTATSAGAA